MNFILKEDGTPAYLKPGEQIAIGFYGDCCSKYVAKSSDGNIRRASEIGHYTLTMQNSVTKNFIGDIDIEIVIYDSNGNTVSHADKILKMYFEERRINKEI